MTKIEALHLMLDGQKVVAVDYPHDQHKAWTYTDGQFYRGGKPKSLVKMNHDDYMIFTPPVKKDIQKLYLWDVVDVSGFMHRTRGFYPTASAVVEHNPKLKVIRRVDPSLLF